MNVVDRKSAPSAPSAVWVRALSRLPFPLLYGIAAFLAWLAYRVFPYRRHVVSENLAKAFPELDEAGLQRVMKGYYVGFAQVLLELIKAATLPPEQFRRRVQAKNFEPVQTLMANGSAAILVAAHQCNWEWMLLWLSLQLGHRVDAAYKPLVNKWAEREILAIRGRFGVRMVPVKELLADIVKHRGQVHAIALLADQEPLTSRRKYWTRFLNRDTAFYLGVEQIARITGYPVFFIAMRRMSRGVYEIEFKPLAAAGESLPVGELTERYARLVEDQIRAAPPDWPWSHKRWRLTKEPSTP